MGIGFAMERYEKEKEVGQGTYGIVYQATQKSTSKKVAIKKIRMGNQKDGVSFTAIREVKNLQKIHHVNVIAVCLLSFSRRQMQEHAFVEQILDVFVKNKNVYLVFDFMPYDLEMVIKV